MFVFIFEEPAAYAQPVKKSFRGGCDPPWSFNTFCVRHDTFSPSFLSQILDLSANSIEALPPLAAALPALVELILDQNSLRALGDELVGLSKLKKLSARSNRIAAVDPFSGQQVCFCDWSLSLLLLQRRSGTTRGRPQKSTTLCGLLSASGYPLTCFALLTASRFVWRK